MRVGNIRKAWGERAQGGRKGENSESKKESGKGVRLTRGLWSKGTQGRRVISRGVSINGDIPHRCSDFLDVLFLAVKIPPFLNHEGSVPLVL